MRDIMQRPARLLRTRFLLLFWVPLSHPDLQWVRSRVRSQSRSPKTASCTPGAVAVLEYPEILLCDRTRQLGTAVVGVGVL